MPSMRLGPLQDLPLEQFFLHENIPPGHRATKRPLSPGGPSRCSPIKRRILNADGLYWPQRSGENRAPSSSPSSPCSRRSARRLSTPLQGPDSPSKKLDFSRLTVSTSTDKLSSKDATFSQSNCTSASALAPSPELRVNNGNWSNVPASPHAHATLVEGGIDHILDSAIKFPVSPTPVPSVVSHDITLPDRHSPHYPGFDVYRDVGESNVMSVSPDPDVDPVGSADDSQLDLAATRREAEKENLAPRRNQGLMGPPPVPGEAAWEKAGLLPPTVRRKETRGRPSAARCSMA